MSTNIPRLHEENPLRILFITLEFDKHITGGIGRVVNGIAPLLGKKTDLQVLLIINFLRIKRINLFRIRNHEWVRKEYRGFGFRFLIKLIKTEKYDAVHFFHVSHAYPKIIRILKKNFPQIKIIYSCHSLLEHENKIRNNYPSLLEHEKFIMNNVDHIHLLNQASLKYFKKSYTPIAEKITCSIIPNGIDEVSFRKKDDFFERSMNQLIRGEERITVLCMSRWSFGKGLEYLLDAIPKVVDSHQNIRFIIAGRKFMSWEYRYRSYLQKINGKIMSLKNYVTPLPWLDDEQRNALFSMADIWVMPSLLEYFPYSILEPMIGKIPIISSRIDCVQEMLEDHEDCLFYEPQDPEQLADRILTLIQNPVLRDKLANNAYQKAKKYYQWDRLSDLYLKMYQTVLNKPVEPSSELEFEFGSKIG